MPTNDLPITIDDEDLYGFEPFAKAMAESIKRMDAPEGVVIAINGIWGSGKTSVLNLITQKLKNSKEIETAHFNPWWFSTSEALTMGFLNDLHVLLGKTLGDKAKAILTQIDGFLLSGESLIKMAGNIAHPKAGDGIAAGMKFGRKLWSKYTTPDTLPQLFDKIRSLLKACDKRFVIIIDDIDRLAPDESLQLFRLIKSVGRLPNVIYILAYDRVLAEKLIQEKFPSEGPHYLDKIVQAAFELPPITNDDLRDQFLKEVSTICPKTEGEDEKYFMNVMLSAVTPTIMTPRDIKRLLGMLEVTWPAVQDELNRADFVALEAIRLKHVGLYKAIRENPGLLTGIQRSTGSDKQRLMEICNQTFLAAAPTSDRDQIKSALMRIFPKLESVWGNIYYSDGSDNDWTRNRRVCSHKFFAAYFRLDVSGDVLPRKDLAEIIACAGNETELMQRFRNGIKTKVKSGRSKASVMLDELTLSADDLKAEDVPAFLKIVFGLYTEFDLEHDKARGFLAITDNRLRLHWLLNAIRPCLEVGKRNDLMIYALTEAPTECLADFAERMDHEHKQKSDGTSTPESERFVDAETAQILVKMATDRVLDDAKNNQLGKCERLMPLLYEFGRMVPGGLEEVRKLTATALADDDFVLNLAFSSIGQTWSQGMGGQGDLVAVGKSKINKRDIGNLVDLEQFSARLMEVRDSGKLTSERKEVLAVFFQLWEEAGKVEAA